MACCHQLVIGRSQNVLIHLHLVNTRIIDKNIDIFYIDPLSDLIPDLEAFGCRDFDYVTSFTKFLILAKIYMQSREVLPGINLDNYMCTPICCDILPVNKGDVGTEYCILAYVIYSCRSTAVRVLPRTTAQCIVTHTCTKFSIAVDTGKETWYRRI